ncbi:TetR/AcrR family transcriptional regulator [Microbacterium sp.]|uniref:TetR/AcrR family transcriptional regulator n=1 Tax=Microbacterium sp. TaxID=51671 RepID=UPI00281152A7|nr:TetR/AcrR family transcriptional regulator [Microbacterium sp.]
MGEARDRWLNEGVLVLAEEGAVGIRIDRIAARLGLSKGSFHHHFDGAGGYKRALLAHVEQISTAALSEAIAEAEREDDARVILERLTELVGSRDSGLYRPKLDVAVRAWANSDADARAAQARIDAARIGALQRVWRPHVSTDAEARRAALLPYLLAVGASTVTPPVSADELTTLFEMLLPLVPSQP